MTARHRFTTWAAAVTASVALGSGLGAAQSRTAPSGGPSEGIKVHGHWTIDVRNPDGSLSSHSEFDNHLSAGGMTLAMALTNWNCQGALDTSATDHFCGVGAWMVGLTSTACRATFCALFQQNMDEGSYLQGNYTVFHNLTVVTPLDPQSQYPNGTIVLSGTVTFPA